MLEGIYYAQNCAGIIRQWLVGCLQTYYTATLSENADESQQFHITRLFRGIIVLQYNNISTLYYTGMIDISVM